MPTCHEIPDHLDTGTHHVHQEQLVLALRALLGPHSVVADVLEVLDVPDEGVVQVPDPGGGLRGLQHAQQQQDQDGGGQQATSSSSSR